MGRRAGPWGFQGVAPPQTCTRDGACRLAGQASERGNGEAGGAPGGRPPRPAHVADRYFRELIQDCTVGTGWAVRSRPPGRPSTSSSLLSWYAGETSEGPATGLSRAGPVFLTRLEV